MSNSVDCVVIGGGVVGLAIARTLAQRGLETIVAEKNAGLGEETSSRNSEVIHAGLYYPENSLKSLLCVRGREMLYAFCVSRQIHHRRCGKLIVATDPSQQDRLQTLMHQATRNGVNDLVALEQKEIEERQPELNCVAGLWSPSTGIVDSHGLMNALAGELEAAGGIVATRTTVTSINCRSSDIELGIRSVDDESVLRARLVVNSAGLSAGDLAMNCSEQPDYSPPVVRYARGNYFTYSGSNPFRTLVYPLPVNNGLGIHATIDLAGALRFGPDVEWIDAIDYDVNPDRRIDFARSIRTYWPGLNEDALVPGYAGIRPKLVGPGETPADFRIDINEVSDQCRLVHLFGIESPGLTASLAIAEYIEARLTDSDQG